MNKIIKRKPSAKRSSSITRKPATRRPRPTIEGLLRILERDLPPQDQLPENPVILQRGSINSCDVVR